MRCRESSLRTGYLLGAGPGRLSLGTAACLAGATLNPRARRDLGSDGRGPGSGAAASGGVEPTGLGTRPGPGTRVAGGRVLGVGGPHAGLAGPICAVQRPVLLGTAGGRGGEVEHADDPVSADPCWGIEAGPGLGRRVAGRRRLRLDQHLP